jgi:hypothetical protein
MWSTLLLPLVLILVFLGTVGWASATNLVLPADGYLTLEFTGGCALAQNKLRLVLPSPRPLFDSPMTPGTPPTLISLGHFTKGTAFEFELDSTVFGRTATWSSNDTKNPQHMTIDHLGVESNTAISHTWVLRWEDTAGDRDFGGLDALLTVTWMD